MEIKFHPTVNIPDTNQLPTDSENQFLCLLRENNDRNTTLLRMGQAYDFDILRFDTVIFVIMG